MKEQPQNQALGASETTRFFCTRISSAAGAAGELCTTKRKEPDMGKRNTNSWEGQHPRCPQPQPEAAQNTKIKLFAKTTQYRNQISTLLGPPLKFQRSNPRCSPTFTPTSLSSSPLPLIACRMRSRRFITYIHLCHRKQLRHLLLVQPDAPIA